jgi:pimeloyl-ACP methyl ester carboxylesterase
LSELDSMIPSESTAPRYAIICGSGSSGSAWERVATELDAVVLPVPDAADVPAMADALGPAVAELPRPRVLIGTSLGAMIALELARETPVDALILVSAGFGIAVNPKVFDQIGAADPEMFERMARGVVADADNPEVLAGARRDFEGCRPGLLLKHMRILAAHRPRSPQGLPPTFVLWGTQDPGVTLAAHAELALRCNAPLMPVGNAGHMPYLEQPSETLGWIRTAVFWSKLETDPNRSPEPATRGSGQTML